MTKTAERELVGMEGTAYQAGAGRHGLRGDMPKSAFPTGPAGESPLCCCDEIPAGACHPLEFKNTPRDEQVDDRLFTSLCPPISL
jgi:hypothetical protein